jgi:hypothetical protein
MSTILVLFLAIIPLAVNNIYLKKEVSFYSQDKFERAFWLYTPFFAILATIACICIKIDNLNKIIKEIKKGAHTQSDVMLYRIFKKNDYSPKKIRNSIFLRFLYRLLGGNYHNLPFSH